MDYKKFPDGWVLCKSKSNPGRNYYFNRRTGKSSWTKPEVVDVPCSKKVVKTEKKRVLEKNKKEEVRKKAPKRKQCDYDEFSKQIKKEVPEKQTTVETKDKCDHQNASDNSHRSLPSPSTKSTPTKNLATNRLTQLRNQLTSEVESDKRQSVEKKRPRVSPKSNAVETPTTSHRPELRSPTFNDSKCTITSQSPSNDSLQSTPSPSQFFAATKIISSMKAQLPEEYNTKAKQKDTFADIEQGICNQMPEYPFNKHPSTPPQFSEANKLVSAIKSKLTYKLTVPEEGTISKFNSAKERMETLRKSLTLEASESNTQESSMPDSNRSPEPMEVEESKEINYSSQASPSAASAANTSHTDLVVVVDTNIFIHELHFITNIMSSHIKGYSELPTLLVPWRVISELDRLKDNSNGSLCKRAKFAMDYLYKLIPENNRIKGQTLRDANSHIYPCETSDDEILNCCLQQADRGKSVILLSNDKNLCNKATINGIKRMGLVELRNELESKPQPVVDPGLYTSMQHYENTIYQLLANILENEMRANYKTLWQNVVCKTPPWELLDVLQALLKHWMAVFNDVFPRIEHLIVSLKKRLTFIKSKEPEALSQEEVSNFKELCMDIAKKCQIIPEYMELAKVTAEKLDRESARVVEDETASRAVVQAFDAKLATHLGIPHTLQDQLPVNEDAEDLVTKLSTFRNQINTLSLAMKGVLSVEETDFIIEDQISRLEGDLRKSLNLIASDSQVISYDALKTFCVKNRNMIRKAYTNLSQLTDMLDTCRKNLQ